MMYLKNFFYGPGGENEGGGTTAPNSEDQQENVAPVVPENNEPPKEDKPFIEKVREALQDWSNKDQADLDFDDTQV